MRATCARCLQSATMLFIDWRSEQDPPKPLPSEPLESDVADACHESSSPFLNLVRSVLSTGSSVSGRASLQLSVVDPFLRLGDSPVRAATAPPGPDRLVGVDRPLSGVVRAA